MRKGIDTLTQMVHRLAANEWQQSTAFIFRNMSGHRIKVLCWDQHGVWLCHRRLHHGKFIWPKSGDTHWTLTQEQFDWLIMGIDWQRLSDQMPNWAIF